MRNRSVPAEMASGPRLAMKLSLAKMTMRREVISIPQGRNSASKSENGADNLEKLKSHWQITSGLSSQQLYC